MFARVEKLKYRNYPKNSNSRKGSSKSWKLLISPQSSRSKPTLPQTRRWISDPKSAWPPPLSTRASFSIRGNKTPSRNTSESDRIENGSSWRRAAGRRGEGWRYQRSHRWKSRSRGSRERERGRGKDEEGSCSRSSKSKSIESISLSSPYFFTLFSLSLSARFQGRQMMRVPRGDVVTSLVLPPFLYPPPCERHLFHPAVTRICNFLFVRPPIRLEDRFEEEFQSGAIFRFVSIA